MENQKIKDNSQKQLKHTFYHLEKNWIQTQFTHYSNWNHPFPSHYPCHVYIPHGNQIRRKLPNMPSTHIISIQKHVEDTKDFFLQRDQCILMILMNQFIVLATQNHYQKRKRVKFSNQPQSASIMAIVFNIITTHYKHFLIAK